MYSLLRAASFIVLVLAGLKKKSSRGTFHLYPPTSLFPLWYDPFCCLAQDPAAELLLVK